MKKLSICVAALLIYCDLAVGQCSNGSEPECMCETADVLCSVTELNGFSSGMDSFQHPQDGPDDFCGGNTVTDNPTWFSFIAWCDEIDMDVELTNCLPGGTNNQFLGAQIVVFDDCTDLNVIDCDSDCSNNSSPIDMSLTLDNLVIGEVYHFMIDGCGGNGNGSTCDYTITVSPTTCDEEIEDWSNSIEGDLAFCIGDMETYTVDDLDGATSYHWYIDGNEEDVTEDPEYTITWDTEGSFELCVDVSNECVDVSEDPGEICETIVVAAPDAGTLTATPDPLCPGGISTVTVSGYNDDPIYSEYLIVTDPDGTVISANLVGTNPIDVTYPECGVIKVFSLNFATAEMVPVPAVDDDYAGSDCQTFCCDEVCEEIEFEDTEDPTFSSPPQDETLDCFDLLPAMMDLLATDNCAADDMAMGTETGSADLCNGGTITREWESTDDCGNTVNHIQTITVDPKEAPTFTTLPADESLDCDGVIPPAIDLMYTNSGSGACLTEGMVSPMVTGGFNICGSTIEYLWEYTDDCGNTIEHTQTITVDPAEAPAFVNPPGDEMLACDDPIPGAIDLEYTNNESGACLIEGMVSPTIDGAFDPCGTLIKYTWIYIDVCGNQIEHVQNITIEPADLPAFVNPPASETLSCGDAIPPAVDLMYSNNDSGLCLIEGSVSPTVTGAFDICGSVIEYFWEYTDACGNTIEHTQTITIDPADEASWDSTPADMTLSCEEASTFSFSDLTYSNSGLPDCLIEGSVSPVISDNTNGCGGTIEAFYSFTDDCGRTLEHTQVITSDPPSEASFINPPANLTVSCDDAPEDADDLEYSNGEMGTCLIEGEAEATISGVIDECGGQLIFSWEFTDACGRLLEYEQIITVDPAPEATFDSQPADMSMSCDEFNNFSPELLTYNNGETGICEISGSQGATSTGSIDECGGVITYQWEFTDDCGRTITEDQEITVDPAPEAMFINAPADMTLDCSEANGPIPSLEYENGESGICEISGDVVAIESGFVDECGGSINYSWTFTDNCNRTITASQDITYEAASEPMFIDPPEDVTVGCDEEVPEWEVLDYDNFEVPPCVINGDVEATVNVTDNVTEYTWEYTNTCTGNTITHTQTLTKLIPVELQEDEFEFTVCIGEEFDLSTLITLIDLNMTDPEFTYHDASPPSGSNEIDPIVIVENDDDETFYILAENEFGCFQVAEVELMPDLEVFAGDDNNDEFCISEAILDFFDFVNSNADPGGEFTQIDGPIDLNISDPEMVNVTDAEQGIYLFEYFVSSGGTCEGDFAEIEIELYPDINIELISISCDPSGNSYTVIITNDDYDVDESAGDITMQSETQVTISDIPIGLDLEVRISDQVTRCEKTYNFIAPDCSCPPVNSPVARDNEVICEGEIIPALFVSVDPDVQANWYNMPTGGVALITNSLSYTPTDTLPGLYTLYVEAESTLQSGCLGPIRTPITLEIIAAPTVTDTTLYLCDATTLTTAELEAVVFDQQLNLTAQYYSSQVDLINGTNPLMFPYNLSSANEILFARVANLVGCTTDISINVVNNLRPIIDAIIQRETCLGDGNGSILITPSNPSASSVLNPLSVSIGSGQAEVANPSINYTDLSPSTYVITVSDSLGCENTQSYVIEQGEELSFDDVVSECSNNGTATDPTDDFYVITFVVSNNSSQPGDYDLDINGTVSTETYGQPVSIELPADGSSVTMTATNADGCNALFDLGDLLACSSDCITLITQLDYLCNNNGTGLDPSDDYYEFSISATSTNGSVAGTYNVLIDGIITYSFPYDELSNFELPASNEIIAITASDSQFGGCIDSADTAPLVPCSDDCLIEALVISKICDNAGTPAIEEDDLFSFDVMVEGTNASSGFLIVETGDTGNYNEVISFSNNFIEDGNVRLTIQDIDDPNCMTLLIVEPTLPCSEPCTTAVVSIETGVCNDNGTLDDASDDFYEATIVVTATDGNVSGVIVTDNFGDSFGPFNYDTEIILGPYPADGQDVTFTITDNVNGSCFQQASVFQASCSDQCVLDATEVSVECNDSGTPNNLADDIAFFDILVVGINNSDSYLIEETGQMGTYGTTLTLQDHLIADGILTITVVDGQDSNCTTMLTMDPPAPCSEPCSIDTIAFDVFCDDNGTTDNNDDDIYSVTLIINGTNVSDDGYILSNGMTGNYGVELEIPDNLITDGTLVLTVTDIENADCFRDISIPAPLPCSEPCTIDIVDLDVLACENNGTGTDPTDDFYSINLEVTTLDGTTSQFIVTDAQGVEYGPFDYDQSTEIGPFVADGIQQMLIVTDLNNPNCLETATVDQAPCSDDCELVALLIATMCNDNGTQGIETDDLYNVTVLIQGVNSSNHYTVSGLGLSGDYGVDLIIPDLLISDGIIDFEFVDAQRTDCTVDLQVTPPAPCSDPCDVNLELLEPQACDDNMTGSDAADDFFTVNVTISAVDGAGSEYTLRDNLGNIYGPFNYGEIISLGPLASDNSTISFGLEDDTNGACALSFDVTSPPCSGCPQTLSLDVINPELNCDITESRLSVITSETPTNISWLGPAGFTATLDQISVTDPGTYIVLVEFADGCSLQDETTITLDDTEPIAELGPDLILDCDQTTVTLTLDNSTLTTNTTVEWVDSDGNVISTEDELIVNTAGTYGLRLTDALSGCSSPIDEITVSLDDGVPQAIIYFDPDSIFNCVVETINLSTEVEPNILYTWIVGDEETTSTSITVTDPETVTLIAIDTLSQCDNESILVLEDLTDYPIIELGDIGDLNCITSEICVSVSSPTTNELLYEWYDANGNSLGNDLQDFCFTESGEYTVELTDPENNCQNEETFNIIAEPTPVVSLPQVINLDIGENYTLMPNLTLDNAEVVSISWESTAQLSCTDCLTPQIISFQDGEVIDLFIVTEDGCELRASTVIDLQREPNIYIPNVFRPGNTDNFTLYANDEIERIVKFQVYDRWGELVFSIEDIPANDPSVGWNGRFRGEEAEQGVYVYAFLVTIQGRDEYQVGDVTLLR